MAIEITVPRLGWSMDEGRFAEWLKRDGEWVDKGQMLFVLEGDKAAQEIESFDEGTLCLSPASPQAGDVVKVAQVIGLLLAKGEAPPPAQAIDNAAKELSSPAGPAVRRMARDRGVASPRARRAAKQLGVDWSSLSGTGRGGRIRERDVQAAAGRRTGDAAEAGAPLSPLRRTIAQRMVESLGATAPVTLTTKVDAANLLNLRGQFKVAAKASDATAAEAMVSKIIVPSVTDLLVKLTAAALARHPALNSRWEGDRIVQPAGIHIGIAVETEAGLLVPVIRDVQSLGVQQIAARSKTLIEQARARRLSADELRGGTFTVTNLGALGIDAFTPIINRGETAILGVGAIRREPVVSADDRIVPGDVMTLSLTFDHRVVDGAPAARFLQTLREAIENPAAWLLT